jgi:hypothetical protein
LNQKPTVEKARNLPAGNEGMTQVMSKVRISAAEVDLSTPLVLEFNEITSLMAISSVGIITVMVLSIFVSASAFFSNKGQELSEQHFTRH